MAGVVTGVGGVFVGLTATLTTSCELPPIWSPGRFPSVFLMTGNVLSSTTIQSLSNVIWPGWPGTPSTRANTTYSTSTVSSPRGFVVDDIGNGTNGALG